MRAPANFDRLARLYRTLEFAMFGRTLERARTAHLPHLAYSAEVLLLGDGDGRVAHRILERSSCRRLVSVDASQAIPSLAEQRITVPEHRDRITFVQQDARTFEVAPGSIDAVVTQFFLDCFTAAETATLVRRLAEAVRPGGLWLYTDFDVPARGSGRWLAHGVIKVLYWFFRWHTGISGAALPPAEVDIRRNGFAAVAERAFAFGMVRSVVYRKQRAKARAHSPGVRRFLSGAATQGAPLFLSAKTIGELRQGVANPGPGRAFGASVHDPH
jgi:SAM-dependent methyltransferase